jgi:hypothetical protein
MMSLPAAFCFVLATARVSGDGRELDDLRRRGELSILHAPTVQAMARDADGMMQVVELFAVEPDGLLRTPAEPFRPSREAQRDAACSVFEDDFDLLVFAA